MHDQLLHGPPSCPGHHFWLSLSQQRAMGWHQFSTLEAKWTAGGQQQPRPRTRFVAQLHPSANRARPGRSRSGAPCSAVLAVNCWLASVTPMRTGPGLHVRLPPRPARWSHVHLYEPRLLSVPLKLGSQLGQRSALGTCCLRARALAAQLERFLHVAVVLHVFAGTAICNV